MVSLFPAISKHPRAFLYGWLPLSNAYGISSVEKNITCLTFNDISSIDNICSSNNIAYVTKAKVTKKAEPQMRDSAFILFLLKNYLAGTDVI